MHVRRLTILLGAAVLLAMAVGIVREIRGPVKLKVPAKLKTLDPHQYETAGDLSCVGFLKRGLKLTPALKRGIMPAHGGLFLRSRDWVRLIAVPDDLAPYVRIRSEDDALQYARLFTSPAIPARMPGTHWREVTAVAAFPRQLRFGRTGWPTAGTYWLVPDTHPRRPSPRYDGIVSDEEWKENALTAPSVRRTREGFAVTRWLFALDKAHRTDTVYLVEHAVSRDGHISERVTPQTKLRGVVFPVPRLL